MARKKNTPDEFTVTYQHEFVKCGKSACRKCNEGIGHGAYWYAYWKIGGKLHKRYIGKKFKALWEFPEFSDKKAYATIEKK